MTRLEYVKRYRRYSNRGTFKTWRSKPTQVTNGLPVKTYPGVGQNLSGPGQNLSGVGQNLSGAGQNLSGVGQNLSGVGQNLSG